jgi:hypothetical protein
MTNEDIKKMNNAYIQIEIVDNFGNKKVLKVEPYFDKKPLGELEFMQALRMLTIEKDKSTYTFFT